MQNRHETGMKNGREIVHKRKEERKGKIKMKKDMERKQEIVRKREEGKKEKK